jgi:hypothetical protein
VAGAPRASQSAVPSGLARVLSAASGSNWRVRRDDWRAPTFELGRAAWARSVSLQIAAIEFTNPTGNSPSKVKLARRVL